MLRILGTMLCIIAVGLPFIAWFGGQEWMRRLAAADPIADQGAMVMAFLILCASFMASLVLLGVGGWMVIKQSV